MLDIVHEKAFAKLNISLDVGKRRDDGYHEMTMIMQSVSFGDDITISLSDILGISLSTNYTYVPNDSKNLAFKAAEIFLEKAEVKKGICISLDKKIPVGAGMAGGSSDAAAVLRGLNKLFGNVFSEKELIELAWLVGSDVAFCTVCGTKLATGRGEKLSKINSLPDCNIVIAKPSFSISTPEFFKKIDAMKLSLHPDTQGILEALNSKDLAGVSRRMYNVFENIGDRRLSVVKEVESAMLEYGALGSIMTGTGSAVFGIFPLNFDCANVVYELKKRYGFCVLSKPEPEIQI